MSSTRSTPIATSASESLNRRVQGAFGCEGADMQLVDGPEDACATAGSAPLLVAPDEP